MDLAPTYLPADWLADTRWVAEREGADDGTFNVPAISAYFERKYGPDAVWKMDRLFAALQYFVLHREDFEGEMRGVSAEYGGAISRAFLLALREVYSRATEEELNEDWPVDRVIEIARRLEDDEA